MKKIRVIILTLILSISMLAPELSLIPAAYAQDETPALSQSIESAEGATDAAACAIDAATDKEGGVSDAEDLAGGNTDAAGAADSNKGGTGDSTASGTGTNDGAANTDEGGTAATPALDAADPADEQGREKALCAAHRQPGEE